MLTHVTTNKVVNLRLLTDVGANWIEHDSKLRATERKAGIAEYLRMQQAR